VNIGTPSVTICMNVVLVKLHPSCWVCGEKFDHPQHDPVAEYLIIMALDHCMPLQETDIQREREEFQLVYTVAHSNPQVIRKLYF
jgi:hypothetical protein